MRIVKEKRIVAAVALVLGLGGVCYGLEISGKRSSGRTGGASPVETGCGSVSEAGTWSQGDCDGAPLDCNGGDGSARDV